MSYCVGFIGAGNMATALAGGLLAHNFSPERLAMSDPRPQALEEHAAKGIFTTHDNIELVRRSDVVVLAVKPQVVTEVLIPLRAIWQERQPLLLSIAAGITLSGLQNLLGGHLAMVRAMPNTPALVQCGASGYFCSDAVQEAQRRQAHEILAAVGVALRVEQEELMDAVTALSGSGPAYCFLVMEAMQAEGMALGLDERTARALTLQTALGAAQMAVTSAVGVDELRRRVTSPGGTTEAALAVMNGKGLKDIFAQAMQAACSRATELGEMLQGSQV